MSEAGFEPTPLVCQSDIEPMYIDKKHQNSAHISIHNIKMFSYMDGYYQKYVNISGKLLLLRGAPILIYRIIKSKIFSNMGIYKMKHIGR